MAKWFTRLVRWYRRRQQARLEAEFERLCAECPPWPDAAETGPELDVLCLYLGEASRE